MNKRAIFIIGLIVLFFVGAYAGAKIGAKQHEDIALDELEIIDEAQNIELNEEVITTSADEPKTTPNTILILKKYYTDCGHTITENSQMPEEMVNLTKSEIIDKYQNWNIEEFSKEQIVLSKELDSFCGEHYLLIEEEGIVKIYSLDEENNRTLLETTEIAYEYLPETDKIILKSGIYIYGREELHKIREDFES